MTARGLKRVSKGYCNDLWKRGWVYFQLGSDITFSRHCISALRKRFAELYWVHWPHSIFSRSTASPWHFCRLLRSRKWIGSKHSVAKAASHICPINREESMKTFKVVWYVSCVRQLYLIEFFEQKCV